MNHHQRAIAVVQKSMDNILEGKTMPGNEIEQWWIDLEQECSGQFQECLDEIENGPRCCCGPCKDFCVNVVKSFLKWKSKR